MAKCCIAGGENNEITENGSNSVIFGGSGNKVTNSFSAILGGMDNTASGYFSAVLGGMNNTVTGTYSTVLGGYTNTVKSDNSAVIAGADNTVECFSCVVCGSGNKILNSSGSNASYNVFICGTCNEATNTAGKYIDIKMAKLELGSKQTLAHQDSSGNWVLNEPPPHPAAEMQKCQYYYERGQARVSGLGIAAEKYSDWTSGYEIMPKRVTPTVTISNLKNNTVAISNPCIVHIVRNSNGKYYISLQEPNREHVFTADTAFMINFDYEASADL